MFTEYQGSEKVARTFVAGHGYKGELLQADLVIMEREGNLVRGVLIIRNGHLEFISAVNERRKRELELYFRMRVAVPE